MDFTQNETIEFSLRIVGAVLTLGAAVGFVVLGRIIGSTRLNKILYTLIGFFALFAILRLVSGFVSVVYALVAANLLFIFLDTALIVQIRRLKRAAPTVELKRERADSIDEAIDLVMAIEKEIPR